MYVKIHEQKKAFDELTCQDNIGIQQQYQPPGCQEDCGRAQVHHGLKYENANQSEEAVLAQTMFLPQNHCFRAFFSAAAGTAP